MADETKKDKKGKGLFLDTGLNDFVEMEGKEENKKKIRA